MKIDLKRFNAYTIARDLLFNAWVIVLAVITGFVGGVCYYSFLHTETYVSSMTVSINLSGYTSEAAALSLSRTVVIAENLDDVFQSKALRDVVEKDLGESLTGSMEARHMEETNLVRITVTDISPEKAYETLVSVYKNYYKVTDFAFSNVIIRTVVNPEMPLEPTNRVTPMAGGILFGVLAGAVIVGIIVIISFLRDTVKNVSDVESELDTKLFATINSARRPSRKLPRNQHRLVVANPLIAPHFAESFYKIAIKLESLYRIKGFKSFMITSVVENEGKTSVAVNIAMTLAENGHRVLLLDADFKNPSTWHFFDEVKNSENTDFRNYFKGTEALSSFIKQDPETGLFIINNSKAYSDSAELLGSSQFKSTLKELKETFDFVIVDTPPCGITVDAEVLSACVDASLLVVRQDVVSVKDINKQIETLSHGNVIGCIFNDVATFGRKGGGCNFNRLYKAEKEEA